MRCTVSLFHAEHRRYTGLRGSVGRHRFLAWPHCFLSPGNRLFAPNSLLKLRSSLNRRHPLVPARACRRTRILRIASQTPGHMSVCTGASHTRTHISSMPVLQQTGKDANKPEVDARGLRGHTPPQRRPVLQYFDRRGVALSGLVSRTLSLTLNRTYLPCIHKLPESFSTPHRNVSIEKNGHELPAPPFSYHHPFRLYEQG